MPRVQSTTPRQPPWRVRPRRSPGLTYGTSWIDFLAHFGRFLEGRSQHLACKLNHADCGAAGLTRVSFDIISPSAASLRLNGRETTGSGSLLSLTRRRSAPSLERIASPSLARMLALVIGLRLREIAFRVLHEVRLSLLIAEAVSLALDRRIDRAIRGGVFAHGETFGAHVIKLTFRSCDGCSGE